MKSVMAFAGAAVLSLLAVVTPASATSAPTLAAPASVTYYSTVSLTGTTPEPAETVEILFRTAGAAAYVVRRHLVSDSAGHFATTYIAVSTQYIAARAGGINSYVRVVHVPTVHCTTSAPAFTKLPTPIPNGAGGDDYAIFTTTRGYTWAGVSDSFGGNQDLITWHGSTPHVLARYHFDGPDPGYALQPIGFTPHYALVVAMYAGGGDARSRGYYWYAGVRYSMSHGAAWQEWRPVGMSDSGKVIGWANTGTAAHPHYYVIVWPHAGDPYQVIADRKSLMPEVAIDGRGDIAWSSATEHATMRTVEGRNHLLQIRMGSDGPWSSFTVSPRGASANAFYADGSYRWLVHPESPDGAVMHAVTITGGNGNSINTVGRQNSVVVGYPTQYLRTAGGAYTPMPAAYFKGGGYGSVSAINMNGTVAFTATSDRRVHFLRCSTS